MKAPYVGHRMSEGVWLGFFSIATVVLLSVNLLDILPSSDQSRQSQGRMNATTSIADLFKSTGGYFIENKGQTNDLVKYYSRGNPSVAFRDDGILFVVRESNEGGSRETWREPVSRSTSSHQITVKSSAYMLRFDGSNKPSPVGIDRLSFNSNFLIGNDSDKWRTDVPSYGGVVYHDLYDEIDLVYRQNANGVKYEFIVDPGADPRAIRMSFEGAGSLRLEDGDIVVQSSAGEVRDSHPYSYKGDGEKVECRFITYGQATYGFECDRRDTSERLVIDPLVYSTFLGGGGYDDGWSIAVDSGGSAYVSGWTNSANFPVALGSFDLSLDGGWDVFVAKLNPAGNSLVYCSYLGGSNDEWRGAIAADAAGKAYLTGWTSSTDFPTTPGAFDVSLNGQEDAYVVVLNVTGSGLVYSTFVGGSHSDDGRGIALDFASNVYVTGDTNSTDFPVTPGAYGTSLAGLADAFVAKLDPAGSTLVYSTYLGGSGGETGYSIATDSAGDAYVAGFTSSDDYPVTASAFQTTFKGGPPGAPYDVYVTKLNRTGTGLVYSTYLGGTGTDTAPALTVDSLGSAYVTGTTGSSDFPVTPGSFNTTLNGSFDVFVVKLDPSGAGLAYSTFLGGRRDDWAGSIVLGPADNAYLVGDTQSANFPVTPNAMDRWFNGIDDVFVTALNATGNGLAYSTFLGGLNVDIGLSIAMDSLNDIYVTGFTRSADFPAIFGSFDPTYNGNGDAFVTKIPAPAPVDLPDLDIAQTDVTFVPPGPIAAGSPVTIDATVHNIGKANASQVWVRFYDGPPPSSPQIGADQVIPTIQRLGGTGTASVIWQAGSSGSHDICVFADPDDVIAEESEFNNVACATIDVLSLPDLTPTSIGIAPPPPVLSNTVALVNVTVANLGDISAGGFDLLLFDDGNGNMSPDAGENISLSSLTGLAVHSQMSVSFNWTASPIGNHSLCAFADPPPSGVSESNETNNVMCMDVLVQPGPILRPDYVPVSPIPLPPIRVGMSSPVSLSIQVLNQGNGTATDNAKVVFYEQSSPPFSTFVLSPLAPATTSSRFTATWTSPALPGSYLVSADVDHDNNVTEWDETNNVYMWTMEVVPGPLTSLLIGNPNYTSTATYVRSSTPLGFSVTDQSGLGIRNTTYRIDGGNWANYTATGQFVLAGEGQHTLEWYSEDYAGNVENASFANLTVDDTPPATTISPATEEVDAGTLFSLGAIDAGSGVNYTEYRVDGGTWTGYTASFTLSDGHHNITYRSVDNLGNLENEKYLDVTVSSPYVPPAIEANYKPLVALVFAIILAVVGVWSSKKKPWKGGKDRMAVAKAFMFTSLPFVLAEAATGVASVLTGQLSIPPPIGAGTVVDAAILVAGLSVALFRATRTRQSSA